MRNSFVENVPNTVAASATVATAQDLEVVRAGRATAWIQKWLEALDASAN